MTESSTNRTPVAASWDAYWRGSGEIGDFSVGGANHPAFDALWNDFFSRAKARYDHPVMLDIATGNGAVIEHALEVFDERHIEIHCIDVSEAAIANVRSRFEPVHAVAADACSIPLPDAGFDLVSSQFGVEYAGLKAVGEALRLLAPGAQLGLLMHCEASSIQRECSVSLRAVNRLRESGFLEGAGAMFRAGFAAVGGADRRPYDEAAKKLAPAVAEVEAILQEHGRRVADDTVARIYDDVARIHLEIQYYDPQEVLNWLQRADAELETYAGRIASMIGAAIDETTFETICAGISDEPGLSIEQAGPLLPPDHDVPLAWVLLARKADRQDP